MRSRALKRSHLPEPRLCRGSLLWAKRLHAQHIAALCRQNSSDSVLAVGAQHSEHAQAVVAGKSMLMLACVVQQSTSL